MRVGFYHDWGTAEIYGDSGSPDQEPHFCGKSGKRGNAAGEMLKWWREPCSCGQSRFWSLSMVAMEGIAGADEIPKTGLFWTKVVEVVEVKGRRSHHHLLA